MKKALTSYESQGFSCLGHLTFVGQLNGIVCAITWVANWPFPHHWSYLDRC